MSFVRSKMKFFRFYNVVSFASLLLPLIISSSSSTQPNEIDDNSSIDLAIEISEITNDNTTQRTKATSRALFTVPRLKMKKRTGGVSYGSSYDDVPPLTFAVSSGALFEVEGLLDSGADVNKLDW